MPSTQDTSRHPDDNRLTHLTTPTDGLPAHFRRVVSFHPRGGRLNPVQRRAWDLHSGRWFIDPADHAGTTLNPMKLFGRDRPLALEIGSGMGEATAGMAANRSELNVLAVEVYKPGVAQTFHHLAKAQVENVRVLRADGIEVLSELIPAASLTEIWLFFPDPWPKARHLKRRLVNPDFAALAASRLKKKGVLRLATDWAPYAEQMLAVCANEPKLKNRYPGWAPRPAFRPRTRFERRGIAEGREVFDLEFVKI